MKFSEIAGETGIFVDGDWIEKKDQDAKGAVRLIQLADVGPGEFRDKSDRHITVEKADELHCTFLRKGDILIARLGDPLCKACVFPLDGMYITAVDVAILRISSDVVNPKYLIYLLNSPWFKDQVKQYESGTTRKRISRKNLDRIEMIFPPLPEQERIVARIEELFSQLDAGVETLKKTKAQLAVYRQAVVEDAIATAKHRGATVLPFGTFVLQYQNGISKRSGEGIQTPVLRLADIENQRISNDDGLRLIGLSKIERDRFVLKRGDLLIVRVNGSENNVGRAIVVDKDDSYAACDHFIRCSVDFSHIIPEYAQLLLDSFSARKHIKENMVSSAGQNTVSQTTMSSIMVYVPDISLQEKIMVSVNERFSMCDSIEQTVDTALQQAEAMRQSILKDAFEGRL